MLDFHRVGWIFDLERVIRRNKRPAAVECCAHRAADKDAHDLLMVAAVTVVCAVQADFGLLQGTCHLSDCVCLVIRRNISPRLVQVLTSDVLRRQTLNTVSRLDTYGGITISPTTR